MTEKKPPECPYCHRLVGFAERHRRFCPACGVELPQASADPRVRHTEAEGERRRQHGEKG